MPKTKLIIIFSAILFFGLFGLAKGSQAATLVCSPSGSGSLSGADWNNTCAFNSTTPVRGNTYYIKGGASYSGHTFNTAASGTSLITIKGATEADHGGMATGWSNSYSVNTLEGGTQAIWTSQLVFNTSYWIFDGSVGPLWSRTASQYGFSMGTMQNAIAIYNTSIPISNITISHLTALAPAGDIIKMFQNTVLATQPISYVNISHCYADGYENFVRLDSTGLIMESWTVEYNIFLNGYSSPSYHGEDINNDNGYANNLTVRYNWFEGRAQGTGCIVVLNAVSGPYYIYGNVFKDMAGIGNGCIAGVDNGYGNHTMTGVVYNNTFINVQYVPYNRGWWIGEDVQSNVKNNLLYNTMADLASDSGDYDAYYDTTKNPSETHGQVSTGNPFVNYTGNNVSLVAPTNAGIALPAPYNTDAFGNMRGADGTWDRGAYEYTSGGGDTTPPAAPSGLSVN